MHLSAGVEKTQISDGLKKGLKSFSSLINSLPIVHPIRKCYRSPTFVSCPLAVGNTGVGILGSQAPWRESSKTKSSLSA